MIVDTSAIVAVLRGEPQGARIREVMGEAPLLEIAAPTYVELTAVVGRDAIARRAVDDLLDLYEVQVVPFDDTLAKIAAAAYQVFGKGSGRPAKLTLGDTYSYALARLREESLLFVGNDFIHTDILPALS